VLRHRLITAAILIPLFVWGTLVLPSRYFALLIGLVVAIGAWEWTGLAGLASKWRYAGVLITLVAMASAAQFMMQGEALSALLGIVVIWWVAGLAWVIAYDRRTPESHGSAGPSLRETGPVRLMRASLGLLILVPPWLALVALHSSGVYGPGYVLFLFVLVWTADSAAYFAGRKWGRAKLAPNVSPGKTWSGVGGGLCMALLVALSGGVVLGLNWEETLRFVVVGGVTAGFSIVGDLLESMFKRQAGVKDSGSLLPGHGGVLDRIDSITAAAPVFLAGLLVSGNPH
jgi:phosphatidate cytidylyltransferase